MTNYKKDCYSRVLIPISLVYDNKIFCIFQHFIYKKDVRMNDFHFGHILLMLLVLFFGILFPLLYLGFSNGIRKKSSESPNRGCWIAVFVISLVVTVIAVLGIVMVVLLGAALTGNLS